jgi:hypothetical protein
LERPAAGALDRTDDLVGDVLSGWHIDGNWFQHTIDCPQQGLLVTGVFTDIALRWGGTILSLGSHKRTVHVLAQYSEGISHLDLFREVLREPLGNFYEVTGAAGDVVLAHPFLEPADRRFQPPDPHWHAGSPPAIGAPRRSCMPPVTPGQSGSTAGRCSPAA